MRLSVVWDESNALPMSGSATLATARFRLATAATRISATRTSGPRAGARSTSPPAVGAVTRRTLPGWAVRVLHPRSGRRRASVRPAEDASGWGHEHLTDNRPDR